MDQGWKERLREAHEKMPQYREMLELAEKFIEEKHAIIGEGGIKPTRIDAGKREEQTSRGLPYLKPEDVIPDLPILEGYFFRLLRAFEKGNPARHAALKEAMARDRFQYDRFLKELLRGGGPAGLPGESSTAEGTLLFYFLAQSLKPFFETYAKTWRTEGAPPSWPHGFCPFCGAEAGMGEIRGEGKRILHCPLCLTEWDFPRLQCPSCGNRDHEKLTYFQQEGESQYRVDLCLVCRHYLKTVDSRESGESPDWDAEDYVTLPLDRLAQAEGYKRPEGIFRKT